MQFQAHLSQAHHLLAQMKGKEWWPITTPTDNCSVLHLGPRLSRAMQSQIQNMPAAGCKSIIPPLSHQMLLGRRKHMEKLITSIGSLQQSEDVCEVESESSMDSGIRQGNVRFLTSSWAASSESVVETGVQGLLEAGQELGFGNIEDLQVLATSITDQVERELDD